MEYKIHCPHQTAVIYRKAEDSDAMECLYKGAWHRSFAPDAWYSPEFLDVPDRAVAYLGWISDSLTMTARQSETVRRCRLSIAKMLRELRSAHRAASFSGDDPVVVKIRMSIYEKILQVRCLSAEIKRKVAELESKTR